VIGLNINLKCFIIFLFLLLRLVRLGGTNGWYLLIYLFDTGFSSFVFHVDLSFLVFKGIWKDAVSFKRR